MGPSYCGRRKYGAFLSNERCVRTCVYHQNLLDKLAIDLREDLVI
jgi:hypothetical protein